MAKEINNQALYNELLELEELHKALAERCYKARIRLGLEVAPAAHKGRKRKGISDVQAAEVRSKFRAKRFK